MPYKLTAKPLITTAAEAFGATSEVEAAIESPARGFNGLG